MADFPVMKSTMFPKSEGAPTSEVAESMYHGRTSSKHTRSSKKRKHRDYTEQGYIGGHHHSDGSI